ncbi:MAG: tail fiber domain-containing protein, partial [Cetobacterium sp.]|uniref:tail fiber domain-containing protein n=1 Tax=Cetobacterium sp. TaxID=2071632 RepID=UPI003EE78C6F
NLGIGNMWNQTQQNQLTGAGILQQHQQNMLNNKWFNQQGQQNAGWDQLNKYLGVAGSIGGMGGTSTSTGPGPDRFGQLVGAGSSIVGGLGMGGFFNSDERLKDNIEVVKAAHEVTLEDGNILLIPNLVVWEWNDKAHALFEEHGYAEVPAPMGVIAQELEALGYSQYVITVETDVEGLDGSVRMVDYPSLIAMMRHVGVIGE